MPALAAMVVVAVVWLGLRVWFWNGYYTEDAPGYVTDAVLTAVNGFSSRSYVNGLNIGTYLPVALPIMLFGKTDLAVGVWPLLCSLIGMTSLGWLAALLFGRSYGLLAAALYATYPGDIFFSTVVMPDAIQSGWLSLAMLCVVRAMKGDDTARRRFLLGGGAAMGLCHLIRAGDALLLPVGLGGVVVMASATAGRTLRTVARDAATFGAGWAAVLVGESLLYLAPTGDPFHRFSVIANHYGGADSTRTWGLNHDPRTVPFSLFPPVPWWLHGGWGRLNADQAYHGLLFCWAAAGLVAATAYVWVSRRSELPGNSRAGVLLASVWFVYPLLFHQFGSQSLTDYVPIHRLSRHFVVYGPGAILATVCGAWVLGQRGARRSHGIRLGTWAAAGLAVTLHMSLNWQGIESAHRAYHRIKGTYVRILDNLPGGPLAIAADPGDLAYFDFWLNPVQGPGVTLIPFENVTGCDALAGKVVLTYSNPGWEGLGALAIQRAVSRLPCLIAPPPSWKLLYDGNPEKVYLAAAN